MSFDQTLADRIRTALDGRAGVAEKKMFGGVAFLLNDHMCCGAHKDSLILRLGAEAGDLALLGPHVRPMDFTGKPMKGWVIVTSEGVHDDDALRRWIEQSLAFAATLTAKPRGGGGAPRARARRT